MVKIHGYEVGDILLFKNKYPCVVFDQYNSSPLCYFGERAIDFCASTSAYLDAIQTGKERWSFKPTGHCSAIHNLAELTPLPKGFVVLSAITSFSENLKNGAYRKLMPHLIPRPTSDMPNLYQYNNDRYSTVYAFLKLEDNKVYKLNDGRGLFVPSFNLIGEVDVLVDGKLTKTKLKEFGGSLFVEYGDVSCDSTVFSIDKIINSDVAKKHLSGKTRTFKAKNFVWSDINIKMPVEDYLATLKNGETVFEINKQTEKMVTSFLEGNEVKQVDGIDFSEFVLISNFLVKRYNGVYIRVLPNVLHTHLPVNRCEQCSFWTKAELGKMVEGQFYCDEHANEYKHKCSVCANSFYAVDVLNLNRDKNIKVCFDCYQTECYECSHHSTPEIHQTNHVCDSATQISSYSYKPKKTRFVGKDSKYPFYLGMELEIHAKNPREVGTFIRNQWPGRFYFKNDSSIRNGGVEIVSTPHSRESFSEIDVSLIQAKFGADVAAEGHGGIHIHVDRKAFENEQLKRVMEFLFKSRTQVQLIAGRTSDYAKIRNPIDAYGNSFKGDDFISYRGGDRYLALNMNNEHTLEYRLFDSTLTNARAQKNFDFVASVWRFAKETTTVDYTNFKSFVASEKEEFPFLNDFILNTKGL